MSRAPLGLAAASAVLVGLVAVSLLAMVPDEVAAASPTGSPTDDLVRLTGGGGGGGSRGQQNYSDAAPIPPANLTQAIKAFDEPREDNSLEAQAKRDYKDNLIRLMAKALGHHKFINELLESKLIDRLDPQQQYIILVPVDEFTRRLDPGTDEKALRVFGFYIVKAGLEDLYTYEEFPTFRTLSNQTIRFNWRVNNEHLLAQGLDVKDGLQIENIALLVIADMLGEPSNDDFWVLMRKSTHLGTLMRMASKHDMVHFFQNIKYEPGGVSLILPSDKAFKALEKKDLEYLERDPALFKRLVWRHTSVPMLTSGSVQFSNKSEWNYPTTNRIWPRLRIWNQLGEEIYLQNPNTNVSYPHWFKVPITINGHLLSPDCRFSPAGVLHIINGFL